MLPALLHCQPWMTGLRGLASSWPCSSVLTQAACAAAGFASSASSDPPYMTRAQLAGQPTHATHPEVLGQDELAPGLHTSEFRRRREALARLMPRGSIAVVPAASTTFVSGVVPYPYRQDADFAYLTGILQHSVAVIQANGSSGTTGQHRFMLFVPPANQERERWDGAWLGPHAAKDVFKADDVFSTEQLGNRLQQLAGGSNQVLFDFERCSGFQYQQIRQALHESIGRGKTQPLRPLMHRLRWTKSPGELRLMKSSADIAASAIHRCIAMSRPGIHEAALAATFEYECRMAGAQRLAYPSVVGGGPDACTIHYSRNDKPVHHGQQVLMDAGCEYYGYTSDVTRTWPVSGRFTGAQRDVYEIVLHARRECLAACKPGSTLGKVHQLSIQLLSEGLRDLGLLPGMSTDAIAAGPYRDFYCHSVGHYLGMDVHDTNTIGPSRTLEPGVVLAIEPGLYIPNQEQYGPFAGVGVRVEDDVLITTHGHQVLSNSLPVEAAEVEALVGAAYDMGGPPAAAAAVA